MDGTKIGTSERTNEACFRGTIDKNIRWSKIGCRNVDFLFQRLATTPTTNAKEIPMRFIRAISACMCATFFAISTPVRALEIKETVSFPTFTYSVSFEELLSQPFAGLVFTKIEYQDSLWADLQVFDKNTTKNSFAVSNYTVAPYFIQLTENWYRLNSPSNTPQQYFSKFVLEKFNYLHKTDERDNDGNYAVQEVPVEVVLYHYKIDTQWLHKIINNSDNTFIIDGEVRAVRMFSRKADELYPKTIADADKVIIEFEPRSINGMNVKIDDSRLLYGNMP